MPIEGANDLNAHDPRTRLVREKYFSLRPKPLEQWLWKRRLPQAAERVFWLHWVEGMRSRDWCSQIPLRQVAKECCIDPSTVTRAYQLLRAVGLVRREDPGRDPKNPFQQATAVTEVRIPKELLANLSQSPNRLQINRLSDLLVSSEPAAARPASTAKPCPTRADMRAMWARTSDTERSRYFHASRAGVASMQFDVATRLTAADQGQLLIQLQQMADARNPPVQAGKSVHSRAADGHAKAQPGRRLSLLTLARMRQRIDEAVAGNDAQEILRQTVWAIEEGALRRFDTALAVNIALKKIREGAWTRPNRMPPNWSRMAARTETCGAA
jgi:hypothetical protein